MEKKIINHFCHKHSLSLTDNVISENESRDCYGCGNHITNLDTAYVCMEEDCLDRPIFHKKCGELPTKIMHPKHPQHPLYLTDFHHRNFEHWWCDLCCRDLDAVLGYECSPCNFVIDLGCEKVSIDALLEEGSELKHPSHPDHPLTLMRKPAFAFYCDGCGTQDVDMAYICSICQFWIHKGCASLPLILPADCQAHHHHHQLSLAFSIPKKHRTYAYNCDVCHKRFDTTCWVYFCSDCRFFAHLSCAATSKTDNVKQDSNLEVDDNEGSDVIQFPIPGNDIANELVTPFVMKEKGLDKIPNVKDMLPTVNMPETTASFSFLFNYHKHPLSLVTESLEDRNRIINDEDQDEDELKICDLCITPVSFPPYYECASCKYFIHSICYLLPKTLSSSSSSSSNNFAHHLYTNCHSTRDKIHKFMLYSTSERTYMDYLLYYCELCSFMTNGIVYECEGCKLKIDMKCACLPTSIRHSSHPHYKPLIMKAITNESGIRWKECHACGYVLYHCKAYCCSADECDFALHLKCAQVPPSIIQREWDKHPLLLTYDASLDHPDEFICDFCEGGMNPKKWMYHCRQCDASFHIFCLKNASGMYRNIKFGRTVALDGVHSHPLTSNYISLMNRCGICRGTVYDFRGLECVPCNFAICLYCSRKALE